MPYREEAEALRARVAQLEQELEQTRRELAAVRGGGEQAASTSGLGEWLAGAPTRIVLERDVNTELSELARERVVDALRTTFDTFGQLSTVGRSLGWSATNLGALAPRNVDVTLTPSDDMTHIRITERLSAYLTGAIVIILLLGALCCFVLLALIQRLTPGLVAGTVILIVVLCLGMRLAYRRAVAKRARQLAATLDVVAKLVEAPAE